MVNDAYLGYVLAYALATVGCVGALRRARHVEDAATRRGLVGLLVGSGGWAALELVGIAVPIAEVQYAAYVLSLVVGLTTVGSWLYFCSAYTGRPFHRTRRYRRTAVAVYLGIVGVKFTNPLHHLYFTAEFVTTPFSHLALEYGLFHWVVTGLSYALVAVGFFMLYEVFLEADFDTRPLGVLVAITAIPVVLDLVGFTSKFLLDVNYEPLGVAVFAVGILYVFETRFLAVQLTDGVDEAVVYLDADGHVLESNRRAQTLFPSLVGATGEAFDEVLPEVADETGVEKSVLERDVDGETRYYLVTDTSFSLGQTNMGQMVVFTDVTETERQRQELERQNQQLEGFAAAIRHELLNTFQIVEGRVKIAGEALDSGDVETARDSLRIASRTTERVSDIVTDLADLARHGQTVEDTSPVAFGEAARTAWEDVETDDLSLSVTEDGDVEADGPRLRSLFESAFEFAVHNDATTVTVALGDDEFTITDDGRPLGDADPEAFFEYGVAVPDAEAGMSLPNLRTFARTHGWTTSIDAEYDDGLRIVVSGVSTIDEQVEAAPEAE